MKHPITWHEECLKNSEQVLAEEERRMAFMQESLEYQRSTVEFLRRQIEAAKQSGKDGFDAERYMATHAPISQYQRYRAAQIRAKEENKHG